MLTARRLDDLEIQLKRQNQIHFQISGAGHEAAQAAAALLLTPGYDWFFPYYRDQALTLGIGCSALDVLLGAVGSSADPTPAAGRCPRTGVGPSSTSWRSRARPARSS